MNVKMTLQGADRFQRWIVRKETCEALSNFLHASDQLGAANAMDELHRALWKEWKERHETND
jgi:hypothetical protein